MRVQQKLGHEFTVGLQTAIMLPNIRISIYIQLFPFCKDNNNKKKNLYTHCKENGRNYTKIRIIALFGDRIMDNYFSFTVLFFCIFILAILLNFLQSIGST